MRSIALVSLLACVFIATVVLAAPRFASASPSVSSEAAHIASLEARVATLERKFRIQTALDASYNGQLSTLASRKVKLRVVSNPTIGSTTVSPGTWGYLTARCLGPDEVLVGGGFGTDYYVYDGSQSIQSDASWRVAVFDPFFVGANRSATLTGSATCLSASW